MSIPHIPESTSGVAAPGSWHPQLPKGTRICLTILLVAWSIHLAERFIPDDFVRLHLYLQRFASRHFWFWAVFDVFLVVVSALALARRSKSLGCAAASILVVTAFIVDPILAVSHGGHWYAPFIPPLMDMAGFEPTLREYVLQVRGGFMWVVTWVGIISALCVVLAARRR